MGDNLVIYAGQKACTLIKENGLTPEMVDTVVGAAGGPKWLVLNGLDRAIFFSWLNRKKQPLTLVGSSIGAWRFSAIAQGEDAYTAFESAYINQSYTSRPSQGDVTRKSLQILDTYLKADNISRILEHPYMRLCLLSVYCRWPFSRDDLKSIAFGMILAPVINALKRTLLKIFFSRALFHDPRIDPFFAGVEDFPLQKIALTAENIRYAILASGSIPLVMEGVRDIQGARKGMYRDGGLVDYHIAFPFKNNRIVLYPHYVNDIIPGWFDKILPWREPEPENLENVVVLCPSDEFVTRLPYSKIPTRKDFRLFWRRDKERIMYWNQVVEESRVLGEEFLSYVARGDILKTIKPISSLISSRRKRLYKGR
jgi:hypothetical protein